MAHPKLYGGIYCSTCNASAVRVERWDAYACPSCGVWLEPPCGDLACVYCQPRPEQPTAEELVDIRARDAAARELRDSTAAARIRKAY